MTVGVKPALIGPVNTLHQSWRGTFDYVPFNERAGLTARNYAARGSAATVTGAPTWASGKAGVGVYCTGGASFDIPDHGTFGDQVFSHRFVVTIKSWLGDYSALMDKFGSSRDCSLFFDTSGNVLYTDIATAGVGASVPTGLVAGGTYDLVWTFDGALSSFYVDGVLKGTDTRTAGSLPQAGPTALGRNPSGGGVNCDAIFHLYHSWRGRVLPAAEVRRIHVEQGGWAPLTRPKLIVAPAGGAGTQTLVPSLFTNTQTFYAPTVTRGAVTLTPSLFTNSQTFFAPTVSATYSLTPALYTNTQTFFAATVSPGVVTLTPALFTNSQTFFAATITNGTALQPSLFTNTNSFFSPTVTVGAVTLTPSLFTNTNTFFAPTVSQAGLQTLTPSLFVNDNTFFSPTVSGGFQSTGGGAWTGKSSGAQKRRKTKAERGEEWQQTLARIANVPPAEIPQPVTVAIDEPAIVAPESSPETIEPLSPLEQADLLAMYGLLPEPQPLPPPVRTVQQKNQDAIIALLLAA